MALKKSQRSLRAWTNKNGELKVERNLQKLENAIYRKKQSKLYLQKSMQLIQERNEKIQQRVNNIQSNLKKLQEKFVSIVKLNDNT